MAHRHGKAWLVPWRTLSIQFCLLWTLGRAQVTIYEQPGFVGPHMNLALGVNSAIVLAEWNTSISSVQVNESYEFVTFDQLNGEGDMAIWRYNTPIMGHWDRIVKSFYVRTSTASKALTPVIANWKCIEKQPPSVPTLYMRVAIVPQSHEVGCYSNDAVNCVDYNTMALCTARIATVADQHPALCGSTHMSYWGDTGYESNTTWCSYAKAMFINNASSGDVPASFLWQCSPIKNTWVALRVMATGECLTADHTFCMPFNTLDQCESRIQSLTDATNSDVILTCPIISSCIREIELPRKATRQETSFQWPWLVAGIGLSLPIVCGIAAWQMLRRKRPLPTSSHIFDTESTLCSSFSSESCNHSEEAPTRSPSTVYAPS